MDSSQLSQGDVLAESGKKHHGLQSLDIHHRTCHAHKHNCNHRSTTQIIGLALSSWHTLANLSSGTMLRRTIPIIILHVVVFGLAVTSATPVTAQTKARGLKLVPHRISLANGKAYNLNLPEEFGISIAAQGLRRVRFMARSPDGRIFVTDMYNLTDNTKGVVYI